MSNIQHSCIAGALITEYLITRFKQQCACAEELAAYNVLHRFLRQTSILFITGLSRRLSGLVSVARHVKVGRRQ